MMKTSFLQSAVLFMALAVPQTRSLPIVCENTRRSLQDADQDSNLRLNLNGVRRLTTVDLFATARTCGEYSYTVDLILLAHLYFLASPSKAAERAGCGHILLHAGYKEDTKTIEKEALFLPDGRASLDSLGYDSERGSIMYFGRHELLDLVRAYDGASKDAPGQENKDYEFVDNNCGDFLANFLHQLGYVASPGKTRIIAMTLLEIAPSFVVNITESESVKKSEIASMSEEEKMIWLVEKRMEQLYETDIKIFGESDGYTNTKTYDDAVKFCGRKQYNRLCTQEEYSKVTNCDWDQCLIDSWAPIADKTNEYIQIGGNCHGGIDSCYTHSSLPGYQTPDWATDDNAWVFRRKVGCSKSPPLPSLFDSSDGYQDTMTYDRPKLFVWLNHSRAFAPRRSTKTW